MGKTLITFENLEQFITDKKLVMDSAKILTPGARDELVKRGIQISYAEAAAPHCQQNHCGHADNHGADCANGDGQCEDMLIGVAAIIKQHYGITDPDELRKVTLETVAVIGKSLQA